MRSKGIAVQDSWLRPWWADGALRGKGEYAIHLCEHFVHWAKEVGVDDKVSKEFCP